MCFVVSMAAPKANWGAQCNSAPPYASVPMGCLHVSKSSLWFLSWPTKSSRKPVIDAGPLACVSVAWRCRVLIHAGIQYAHFCPYPLTSGLEMSPQLEDTATFWPLTVMVPDLITSSLSCRTGLCAVEGDVISKLRWDHPSQTQKALLNPQMHILTSKHSMVRSNTPSPDLSLLSSHIVCSAQTSPFPPAPIPSPSASLLWLSPTTFLPWPHDCDTSKRTPHFYFLLPFNPSPCISQTDLEKVNNTHPFLKLLCGMWHSTTLRIKSRLSPMTYRVHHDPAPAFGFLLHHPCNYSHISPFCS